MANYLIDKINDGSNKWWLEKGVYKAECNACTVDEGTFIDSDEGTTQAGDVRTIYLQPYGGSSTISPEFESIKGGLTILCSDVAGYTASINICAADATKIQIGNNTSFVKELVNPAGTNISRISQYFGFGKSFLISYDSNINKWILLTDLEITGNEFIDEEFHENNLPYSFNPYVINDYMNTRSQCSYGTCSTGASTSEKSVSANGFKFMIGHVLGVNFSTANTTSTPTLKVGNNSAKSIYVGNTTPNGTFNVLKWSANTMVYFMWDGTYFRYITSVSAGSVKSSRGANTWYGTSSTEATTQAKTSTIDNFVLTQGAVVYITFSTANTYTSNKITLNINSTGAKDVYYNGAVTSSTNTLPWKAGETLCFVYSGSYYYFAGRSNGPSFGTSTSTYLRNDGTWATPSFTEQYTGTVTSVGLSNATNGGLTISGSPVTGSGSITVGHSNVLSSAQTTQDLYPIKIDKNGHISAYGTAVTSLPASDVSSWAKASSKPSYTASEVSAVALSDKYTRSSAGDLGWSNQSEGDSKVIAKSALAFWDGSYSETVAQESSDVYSSNLWRCKTGGIVGSYQASATTVANLLTQLRYKNGSMGSVNIGTAYTLNGTTIPTGWYNFMYSPHRWGGNQNASSAAYRDNTDYGMLLLASMTNENGIFWIRFSSGAIANAKSLLTNDIVMYNRGTSSDTITLTSGTITQIVLNNQLINTNTGLYSISNGGIKVNCAGYYRVTAGAYFGTATAAYQADVFVHKKTGSYSNDVSYEIGSGRDCIGTTYGGNPEPQFTKIVSASKDQVFYISVRATGGSGTNLYPGNKMTFLQIQCLGS